jgi:hypothetical protein
MPEVYIYERRLLRGTATKMTIEGDDADVVVRAEPSGIVSLPRVPWSSTVVTAGSKRVIAESRVVLGEKVGHATVTVLRGSERFESTVEVVDADVEMMGFRYDGGVGRSGILFLDAILVPSVNVRTKGETYADFYVDNAVNVVWSSSNPAVMEIRNGSEVVPRSEGTAKLIAECRYRPSLRREQQIQVAEPPEIPSF